MKKNLCFTVLIFLLTTYGSIAKSQSFCLQDSMGKDCGGNPTYKISEIAFVLNRLEPMVYDDFLVHLDADGGDKSPVFIGWRYRATFTANIVSSKVFRKFGNLYVNLNNVRSISINSTGAKVSFQHYDLEVKEEDLEDLRKFAEKQGIADGKIKGLQKVVVKPGDAGKTIMVKR